MFTISQNITRSPFTMSDRKTSWKPNTASILPATHAQALSVLLMYEVGVSRPCAICWRDGLNNAEDKLTLRSQESNRRSCNQLIPANKREKTILSIIVYGWYPLLAFLGTQTIDWRKKQPSYQENLLIGYCGWKNQHRAADATRYFFYHPGYVERQLTEQLQTTATKLRPRVYFEDNAYEKLRKAYFTFGLRCVHGARKLPVSPFPCGLRAEAGDCREIFVRIHRQRSLYDFV